MTDLMLLVAVGLLSFSQVLQKLGAMRRLQSATGAGQWIAALFSPELVAAAVSIILGTLIWLYVLYDMEVSRAFPFLSLGSVVVVLVSRFVLGESVSAYRWAGVVLVTIGVALVAQS
jgi:drug/metabolite transporter (DMT)-like permease